MELHDSQKPGTPSVSMPGYLIKAVDTAARKRHITRSQWIRDACLTQLAIERIPVPEPDAEPKAS